MMTDYKATPEQEDALARAWAFQQQWAQRGDEDSACFLELRSRIERLELGAGIHDAVIKTLKSPTSTVLSPAAQAVLDDYGDFEAANTDAMAAALRAVADHVVPLELHPRFYKDCCQYSEVQTRARIRAELLAIADELEQLDD